MCVHNCVFVCVGASVCVCVVCCKIHIHKKSIRALPDPLLSAGGMLSCDSVERHINECLVLILFLLPGYYDNRLWDDC